MKIHEYQAKGILRRYGVPTPEGSPAKSAEEAVEVAKGMSGPIWVVKSQIHAGGRGKGRFKGDVSDAELEKAARGEDAEGKGGVRLCRSVEEVGEAASAMLGSVLVTKQTGIEGKQVNTVYIEGGCDIQRELYLAVMLDRGCNRVLLMASAEGGTEIEEVAEHNPDAIKKTWVEPEVGLAGWQARAMAFELGLSGKAVRNFASFAAKLYKAYVETDADMLEINPLVVTGDGSIIALDCKMGFDGNALYRHKDIVEMRDLSEEEETEIEASKYGLSFIKLDGNIGCLVNGAGLAMATMDIIQYKGAMPANFLDVGGGATQATVTAAFGIITSDPAVKGILVNIFGGIMKCDVIARGVIAAVEETGLAVPLVCRLSGTNAELGKEILANSGLNIIPANSLDEAADAIVAAIQ